MVTKIDSFCSMMMKKSINNKKSTLISTFFSLSLFSRCSRPQFMKKEKNPIYLLHMKLTPKNYVSKFLKILCSMFMCEKKRERERRELNWRAFSSLLNLDWFKMCSLSSNMCLKSIFKIFVVVVVSTTTHFFSL